MVETEQLDKVDDACGKVGIGNAKALSALIFAVLGAAVVHFAPAELVERLYSERVFPIAHRLQASIFSRLRYSASEIGLVALGLFLAFRAFRSARMVVHRECSFGALTLAAMRRALWLCCTLYSAFLLLWGFQHARQPFAVHAGLQASLERADEARLGDELASLCRDLVTDCNELRTTVEHSQLELTGTGHRGGTDAQVAMERFAAATPIFRGLTPRFRIAFASPILSRLGISGIYSPFTGDAHVNGDIPIWSRPFTACHEMAHQLGIASEGEANFVAWQACQKSGVPGLLYSSNMIALQLGLSALAHADADRDEAKNRARLIVDSLSEDVRQDYEKAGAWWRAQLGIISDLAELSNDAYLRSQGQSEGITSYGEMVDLILAERRP